MKVAVWSTGHTIADTVARALERGLGARLYNTYETLGDDLSGELPDADIHIAYGILRGTTDVFRKAHKRPWFNVDRGYWKPDHFDGYYRISLRGTQQTNLTGLPIDYDRWEKLNIPILPWRGFDASRPVLICPPTEYVKGFFSDIDDDKWLLSAIKHLSDNGFHNIKIRTKDMPMNAAEEDMLNSNFIYTFNCSLGWKGMRMGIPCISDPQHSIIGSFFSDKIGNKSSDRKINLDRESEIQDKSRLELFALQAGLQLTLDEIRTGKLWQILQNLMSSSVMTGAKP